MCTIETLGESLQDLIFEAVADPSQNGHLRLHTWNSRHHSTTTLRLEHEGASYVPMKLPSGLVQFVRFAPRSSAFGSTSRIVMRSVISSRSTRSFNPSSLICSRLSPWQPGSAIA